MIQINLALNKKETQNLKYRIWRAKNLERRRQYQREYQKKWAKKPEQRKKILEMNARWRRKQDERKPGWRTEHSRKWRAANPDKSREYFRLYRRQYIKDHPEYNKTYYSKNKEQILANAKQWREANTEQFRAIQKRSSRKNQPKISARMRAYWIKKNYGLTMEQYQRISEKQNGRCAICLCPPTTGQKKLVVDHDHSTGKIRELLCDVCNRGIGFFNEDPRKLRLAAEYLEYHHAS